MKSKDGLKKHLVKSVIEPTAYNKYIYIFAFGYAQICYGKLHVFPIHIQSNMTSFSSFWSVLKSHAKKCFDNFITAVQPCHTSHLNCSGEGDTLFSFFPDSQFFCVFYIKFHSFFQHFNSMLWRVSLACDTEFWA